MKLLCALDSVYFSLNSLFFKFFFFFSLIQIYHWFHLYIYCHWLGWGTHNEIYFRNLLRWLGSWRVGDSGKQERHICWRPEEFSKGTMKGIRGSYWKRQLLLLLCDHSSSKDVFLRNVLFDVRISCIVHAFGILSFIKTGFTD